ncbi:hypothetical protein QZH41_004621 [Actinostola sp. cb2023]|nr:hypothetical protein QZH41_004621 [Actinostola sp. cb2023]
MSPKALSTIDTLVEMQQILYSPDEKRTPALILRYYNQAWYHSILLKTAIDAPKKLTRRKMFGVYYHNLSAHAGLMLRLVSGQAANAEAQERVFNSIKRITKQTSNNHPRQIITNLFIRLQAEKEMGLQGDDVSQQQAHISNLARSLPPATNTRIPLSIIKKHSREWQAHLQQISDYLKEGEGVWWSKTGDFVEFHDVTKHPLPEDTGPQLHHFRSTNLEKEAIRLEDCWIECLTNQTVIPTHIIRIDQADGTTVRLYTNYFNDKASLPTEDDIDNDQMEIETPNTISHRHHKEQLIEEEEQLEEEEEIIDISPTHDDIIDFEDYDIPLHELEHHDPTTDIPKNNENDFSPSQLAISNNTSKSNHEVQEQQQQQTEEANAKNQLQTHLEWASEKGYEKQLHELSAKELDDNLKLFYTEVRNKEAGEYSRNMLIGLRSGLERYLNSPPHNKGIQISGNTLFKKSNMMLEAKLKNLKQQGKQSVQHKPAIVDKDLRKLKASAAISPSLPSTLLMNVWFHYHTVLVPPWS